MKLRNHLMFAIFTLGLLGVFGCTGEDGAKTGVTNGVSAALSVLIQAPVTQFIKNTFPTK